MSECVVRMEMPKSCFECPFSIIDDTADGAWCNALAQQVYLDRDEDCPIICQLPEGHGRLIDASYVIDVMQDELDNDVPITVDDCFQIECKIPTIVPAEAERSET